MEMKTMSETETVQNQLPKKESVTLRINDRNINKDIPEVDVEAEDEDEKPSKEPRISCCYGIMVFIGLAASLFGMTLVVIYAGFWTNYAMQGKYKHFIYPFCGFKVYS